MFPFLIGLLGGAAAGGGYVLLNNPRSGSENQIFVKNYVNNTKENVKDVQDKASNVQAAINDVKTEVTKLQVGFIPEVKTIVEDFQTEAAVYSRRITDEIDVINQHATVMTNRINAQNQEVQVDLTGNQESE